MNYINLVGDSQFIDIQNNTDDGIATVNHLIGYTENLSLDGAEDYISFEVDPGGHVVTMQQDNIQSSIIDAINNISTEAFYQSDICNQLLDIEERIDNADASPGIMNVSVGFNLDIGGQDMYNEFMEACSYSNSINGNQESELRIFISCPTLNHTHEVSFLVPMQQIIYDLFQVEFSLGTACPSDTPIQIQGYINTPNGWTYIFGEFNGVAEDLRNDAILQLYTQKVLDYYNINIPFYSYSIPGVFAICAIPGHQHTVLIDYEDWKSECIGLGFIPIGFRVSAGYDIILQQYREIDLNIMGLALMTHISEAYGGPGDDFHNAFKWVPSSVSSFITSQNIDQAANTFDGLERTNIIKENSALYSNSGAELLIKDVENGVDLQTLAEYAGYTMIDPGRFNISTGTGWRHYAPTVGQLLLLTPYAGSIQEASNLFVQEWMNLGLRGDIDPYIDLSLIFNTYSGNRYVVTSNRHSSNYYWVLKFDLNTPYQFNKQERDYFSSNYTGMTYLPCFDSANIEVIC